MQRTYEARRRPRRSIAHDAVVGDLRRQRSAGSGRVDQRDRRSACAFGQQSRALRASALCEVPRSAAWRRARPRRRSTRALSVARDGRCRAGASMQPRAVACARTLAPAAMRERRRRWKGAQLASSRSTTVKATAESGDAGWRSRARSRTSPPAPARAAGRDACERCRLRGGGAGTRAEHLLRALERSGKLTLSARVGRARSVRVSGENRRESLL